MTTLPAEFPALAPPRLPASPRSRWWQRRRPWQPSPGHLAAARVLALEIGSALTHNLREHSYVTSQGTGICAWLTGALSEADMAARYAAARQELANIRRDVQWSPDAAEFTEAAAAFARFLAGTRAGGI